MNDNRPRYEGKCCKCGKVFYACKSLGVAVGLLDVGYGECIGCDESIALRFNEEDKTVSVELWEDYIDSIDIESEDDTNE